MWRCVVLSQFVCVCIYVCLCVCVCVCACMCVVGESLCGIYIHDVDSEVSLYVLYVLYPEGPTVSKQVRTPLFPLTDGGKSCTLSTGTRKAGRLVSALCHQWDRSVSAPSQQGAEPCTTAFYHAGEALTDSSTFILYYVLYCTVCVVYNMHVFREGINIRS